VAIYAWGGGESWPDLWRNRVAGTQILVADSQPTAVVKATPRVFKRLSRVNLPPGGNATADALKAANALIGYDEMTWPLQPGEIDWWESILPAIGRNDNPALQSSQVVIASGIVPPVNGSDWQRWAAAVRGNPRVKFAVEGYHHSSIWGDTIDDLRWYERIWFSLVQGQSLLARSILLQTIADAPDKAATYNQPAYAACSYDPYLLKPQADEQAFYEWLMAGCLDFGTWGHTYSTEASRSDMADSMRRATRRWLVSRYGVPPIQQA
jgi:hypothetical protein